MKVLLTYAVEAEFAPWRKLRTLEKVFVNGFELQRAQIGRASVDFLVTGMGVANARRSAEAVLTKDYDFCIVSGFAGALKPSVKLGDVVAARKVQQDGSGGTVICARNLWTRAFSDGAKEIQSLLTADHVVNTAEEKARLAPFAEAVDMESFAIMDAARARNLPAIAIRVISDSFDRDLPVDLDIMVDKQGNVSVGGVVRYVARHPLMLPALLRLGRESKTAAETLANFLEAHLKKMSFATHGQLPPELQEVAAS